MKKFLILASCFLAATLLTGCWGGGGGGGSAGGGGGGFDVAAVLEGGTAGGGDSSVLGGGSGDSLPHNPEPATIALLGGGLAAYAFLRRKKR